jgi:protein-disulfide isomerase
MRAALEDGPGPKPAAGSATASAAGVERVPAARDAQFLEHSPASESGGDIMADHVQEPESAQNRANAGSAPATAVGDDDHVLGLSDAPLTLVVYGDYQCPFSRGLMPIVRDVRGRLGDELRYVYRHFPRPEIHLHAQKAAETAEAAGAQGMFWAIHDMLFANQRELDVPDLVRYVHLLGLDAHRVQQELAGNRYAARVARDVASGRASGVESTPGIFVNGAHYDGIHETDVLVAALLRAGGIA